jgi:tRNA(Leu) C34 or U34 (ribose-2'-O)-methylase TrmL
METVKSAREVTPAVALINPKYPRNVAESLRACSCYGAKQLWYTGPRVPEALKRMVSKGSSPKKIRLPREERMKGFKEVHLGHVDEKVFDLFPPHTVPVAVEVSVSAQNLFDFEHPRNALYVFGPEDGGLTRVHKQLCHRFVVIPMFHCANLAAAVYTVLYDRMLKDHRDREAGDPSLFPNIPPLPGEAGYEGRGFISGTLEWEDQ